MLLFYFYVTNIFVILCEEEEKCEERCEEN